MEDLLLKFNSLDGFGRQQLLEFLDFLLQKHHVGKVSKAFPENQPPSRKPWPVNVVERALMSKGFFRLLVSMNADEFFERL